MGTELRIDKPKSQKTPDRLIGVYVVDYSKRRSVETLVDARGVLVAVNELPPYQLPISSDEIREARSLASQNEHLTQALGRHEATFVSPFVPQGASSKKRVVGLHYFHTDHERPASPRPLGDVEVDLTDGTVRFIGIESEDRGHGDIR